MSGLHGRTRDGRPDERHGRTRDGRPDERHGRTRDCRPDELHGGMRDGRPDERPVANPSDPRRPNTGSRTMSDSDDTAELTDRARTGSRRHRWVGLLGVAGRWVRRRDSAGRRGPWVSVASVAVPIALLVVITGLAIGIANPLYVDGGSAEYWIVPEERGGESALVSTGGTQFADVHATNDELLADDRVAYATPILTEVVRVESNAGDVEYLFVVGVVPSEELDDVFGLSTSSMTPGDPHYANGTYDGERTDEMVLSSGAATALNASAGSTITTTSTPAERTFTVVDLQDDAAGGWAGTAPVALVQLSEAQTLTGADSHDQADQFIAGVDSPRGDAALEGVYPNSVVLTSGEFALRSMTEESVPAALSLLSFVVTVIIGVLFVMTTRGVELASDRRQLQTLSALGFSRQSRRTLVATRVLVLVLAGGFVGGVTGYLGIVALNAVGEYAFEVGPIAFRHPGLLGYGVAAGLTIGLLTVPYLLVLLRRLDRRGAI